MKDKQSYSALPVPALAKIQQYITSLAGDGSFYGSITLKFQGAQGCVYVVTERGQRPQELEVEIG